MNQDKSLPAIAVVIPCYRVAGKILDVIAGIPAMVQRIYVVDDACPDHSGSLVSTQCFDIRVLVLQNERNLGVGGAVMTGYRQAIADKMDVIVKMDGDGQMDPCMLLQLIEPILQREADYTKGNRFFDLSNIRRMPTIRIFGNACLSFMAKLSTGYWDIFDPTNGYTAIHGEVARRLPLDKISQRYFFETDMLFRLNTLKAVVVDVPMDPIYAEETSHLKISRILGEFVAKHFRNFAKRVFYNYFLRDMSVASLELVFGMILTAFAAVFGGIHWLQSYKAGLATPPGTIMISVVCAITGLQLLLAFSGYDISTVPRRPIHSSKRA